MDKLNEIFQKTAAKLYDEYGPSNSKKVLSTQEVHNILLDLEVQVHDSILEPMYEAVNTVLKDL